MRKLASYGAVAAAVALACGPLSAQEDRDVAELEANAQEELTEAERAEVERQTEQLRQRTEELQQQTEELEEGTEELADDREVMERRDELVQMADETLARLTEQNESAAALYEEAHGYAVFDTTKGGLIVTGAGGTGVAMEKDGAERTFMHLGQAGVGLGAGLENYKLVLMFADEQTYDDFVAGQWDGSISAQAAAGEEGVSAEEQFVDGVKAYRLTDAGLMAQVDVSGIRFWPSEDLNELQFAEAEGSNEVIDETEEAVDEAAEETGEAVEEAADETEEAVDEAADEAEDALE